MRLPRKYKPLMVNAPGSNVAVPSAKPATAIDVPGQAVTSVEVQTDGNPRSLQSTSNEPQTTLSAEERSPPPVARQGVCARDLMSMPPTPGAQSSARRLSSRAGGGDRSATESDCAVEDPEPSPTPGDPSCCTLYPVSDNGTTAPLPAYEDFYLQSRLALRRELTRGRRTRRQNRRTEARRPLLEVPSRTAVAPPAAEARGQVAKRSPGTATNPERPDAVAVGRSPTRRAGRRRSPPVDGAQTLPPTTKKSSTGAPAAGGRKKDAKPRRARRAGTRRPAEGAAAASGESVDGGAACGHVTSLERARNRRGRVGSCNTTEARECADDYRRDARHRAGTGSPQPTTTTAGTISVGTRDGVNADARAVEAPGEAEERGQKGVTEEDRRTDGQAALEDSGRALTIACQPDGVSAHRAAGGEGLGGIPSAKVPENIRRPLMLLRNKSPINLEAGGGHPSKHKDGEPDRTESPRSISPEEWGADVTHPGGTGACSVTGTSNNSGLSLGGIAGVSLDLSILQEQNMERSYDFSDNGTLHIQGFVLKPDGMKSAPGPDDRGNDRPPTASVGFGASSMIRGDRVGPRVSRCHSVGGLLSIRFRACRKCSALMTPELITPREHSRPPWCHAQHPAGSLGLDFAPGRNGTPRHQRKTLPIRNISSLVGTNTLLCSWAVLPRHAELPQWHEARAEICSRFATGSLLASKGLARLSPAQSTSPDGGHRCRMVSRHEFSRGAP